MKPGQEINFDGLVGPTHNYAGLSVGNIASVSHRGSVSNPRAAALQGLAKMKFLADLGLKQALLPPHERPAMATLRTLGFAGSDAAVLAVVAKVSPTLLAACSSASNMWVANAATVTPSIDAPDGRVHFTPANLAAKFHRSIEAGQTGRSLRAIFHNKKHFAVHEPVPSGQGMGDEGAANHTRFASTQGGAGLHLFVYGHRAFEPSKRPVKFPSRQAWEASVAVARQHGLTEENVFHAQQAPSAIDAGVFHNDVVSVGQENVFFYHEQAFVNTVAVIAELKRRFQKQNRGVEFVAIRVTAKRVPLRDAVKSYLFNSQLVTLELGGMALIAPADCQATPTVRAFLHELVGRGETPIRQVHFLDLKESMRNGGGPACLRLRVVLNETEIAALPQGVFINDRTYPEIIAWVKRHYREKLTPSDLSDPRLLEETRRALAELTDLLGLGRIYPFQLDQA